MTLEVEDPELVTLEEFTVAGLAHRGPPEDDNEALWNDFDVRVGDFATLTGEEDRYGVVYQYDQSGEEFTYVAGVAVDDLSDLSPELTVVEIPHAEYAVFEMDAAAVDDLLNQVAHDWAEDAGNAPVEGPIFEKYGPDYDPTRRTEGYELYVPVDGDVDRR